MPVEGLARSVCLRMVLCMLSRPLLHLPLGSDVAYHSDRRVQRFFLEESGTRPEYKSNSNDRLTAIMRQLSTSAANEIDGKLSDALRNFLFDAGEDLAGRNIFRGRDIGVPTYAGLAKCFGIKPNARVRTERKSSVSLRTIDAQSSSDRTLCSAVVGIRRLP